MHFLSEFDFKIIYPLESESPETNKIAKLFS